MNKYKAFSYFLKFFFTFVIGLSLLSLFIFSFVITFENNRYGNYGSSQADFPVILLIFGTLSFFAWIILTKRYFFRLFVTIKNDKIKYKCEECNNILIIPLINVIETETKCLLCSKCNGFLRNID